MKTTRKGTSRTSILRAAAALALPITAPLAPAHAAPSIEAYAVPASLHRLNANVVHTRANMDVLTKIGKGFADGYRVTSANYIFTSPDRVEIHAHAGAISATQIYTNETRRTDFGPIHHTDDISKDITRRQTVFALGLLPQNYLDTVRSSYVGQDTVGGVECDVFMLQYVTDQPTDKRRFEVWISKAQRYVVKKRVWDGGNNEHETIVYTAPIQALPGVWVPTKVEAYDKDGELGGVAEQKDIKAY